jgi:hypothetical protein
MDRAGHEQYWANYKAVLAEISSIEVVVDRLEMVYQRVIAEKQGGKQG